ELHHAPHGCDRPRLARAHHLAAVALARLDRENEAHGQWNKALELDPDFDLARDNVNDSWKPWAEREGPWAFAAPLWTSPRTIAEFRARLLDPDGKTPNDFAERARRLLEERPEVAAIASVILDRGDPCLRPFFIELTIAADTPAMRHVLERFAFGQRGSDRQRMQALTHLDKVQALASKRARIWHNGEWREVLLQMFDVHDEPTPLSDPQADDLSNEAYWALTEDDGARAEKLLKQALERVPDDPGLEFNLAQAYEAQGRDEEARHHRRWIRQRWPDYLFGRVMAAHEFISAGDCDAADAELAPLRERQRLHHTEFSAFMYAQVRLFHARRNSAAARSWFDLWERLNPDDPLLGRARRLLDPRLGALGRMVGELLPPE
ncbi:MAG: tetratricopeptide repeat protein, partial [Pirellulales bacterium]